MFKVKNPLSQLGLILNPGNLSPYLLVSLALITQGNLAIKFLGVLLALFHIAKKISFKLTYIQYFYLALIFYTLISGAFYFSSSNYLITLSLVLICWLISFITVTHIQTYIKKISLFRLQNTLLAFFLLNIAILIGQFIWLTVSFSSINPYGVSASAGDYMKGIFSNSSVFMIAMSFFFVYYLFHKQHYLMLIAFIAMLSTTYMSGLVLFIFSISVAILFLSKLKLSTKFSFILLSLFFIFIFTLVSPENVLYAKGYILRIIHAENVPFKIVSFHQTFSFWLDSLKNFFFGAGPGNFSSRAAFIVSGDYVSWYPEKYIYISDAFKENHFSLWTHDFNNPWDNRNNTANQPFSFYNKIVGEYGLLGILFFCVFYIGFLWKNREKLTYAKYLFISLLSYFLLDYWFEYFSIVILYEVFTITNIKESSFNSLINLDEQTTKPNLDFTS